MKCFSDRWWFCPYCFSQCEIFGLLVAKNFRKQKESKITLLISILLPIIFGLTLVFYGYSIEEVPEVNIVQFNALSLEEPWKALIEKINFRRNQLIQEQSTFQSNVFVPEIIFGYAPNGSYAINKLINTALSKLSMSAQQIIGYKNCEILRARASADQYIASICFHNDFKNDQILPNGLPLQLKFSIVMPSEFRLYEHLWMGASWTMDKIDDSHHIFEDNSSDENDDSSGYVREGFISLQYHVSYTYLEMAADSGAKPLPKVELRRFDANPNIHKLFIDGSDTSIVFVLIVGFMFPVAILAKHIVEERESGQNRGLQINNISTTMQTAAWYFNGLCQFMISAIVLTLLLKLEWNGQRPAIRKCPVYILFAFFISYTISAVGFVILMASMMCSTKMTLAVVPIFWLLTPLPFLPVQPFLSYWTNFLFTISSVLFCNVMFKHGLRKLLRFEEYPIHFTNDQYLFSNIMENEHTLFMVAVIFCLQAIFYLLAALIIYGSIFPYFRNAIECIYLKNAWNAIRRMVKRRKRRRIQEREHVVHLKAQESRRISEIADEKEQLTRTTVLIDRNSDQTNRNATNSMQSDNPIKTSETSTSSTIKSDRNDIKTGKGMWNWWYPKLNVINRDDENRQREFEKFQKYGLEGTKEDSSNDNSVDEAQSRMDNETPAIEFEQVSKKYRKTFVVKYFSLKVYEGEVVVILGHNASGKTTLMKMLSREISPTTGNIYISGYNLSKQTKMAFQNVGMALHHIDLFAEFTLADHLMYFCRLRGLGQRQSQSDVEIYIKSLQLNDIRDKEVKYLTTGQKQLLRTLCAFAGRTKIVMLDKPLEGVDEHKCKLFFDFVADQRSGRTIFVTTNHPKVATSLADRVAILVEGQLRSFTTEKRLFQKYKDAYRLTCFTKESCDVLKLHIYLSYYIPGIEMESNVGNTVVFLIKYTNLINIVKLLEELPRNLEDLQLESYQLIESSLEIIMFNALTSELIMGKTTRTVRRHTINHIISTTEALKNVASKIRRIEDTHLLNQKSQRTVGIRLILAHIGEVLKKRYLVAIRYSVLPIYQIFLPVLLALWALCWPHLRSVREVSPTTYFKLSDFHGCAITIMRQNSKLNTSKSVAIYKAIQHYISEMGVQQLSSDIDPMLYIENQLTKNYLLTNVKFVIAAIFEENKVEALFNFNMHRTAPLSLSLVMDALATGYVNENSHIIVFKESLPYSTIHKVTLQSGLSCHDLIFFSTIGFGFCCIGALPILNISLTRGHRYGRLELIAGMRQWTLLVASLIYGMLQALVSLLPINTAVIVFRYKLLMCLDNYVIYFYMMISIVFCVQSVNNFVTIWMVNVKIIYVSILTFYCWGVLICLLQFESNTLDTPKMFGKYWLDFHPFYALTHNLLRMHKVSLIKEMCRDTQTFETSVYLELCQVKPNCCDKKLQHFNFLYHMWPINLLILLLWLLFYVKLKWKSLKYKPKVDKLFWDSDPDSKYDQEILHLKERSDLDNTWINEKTRVQTLERHRIRDKALHVENLGMFFGQQVVLKHINFMLEHNQLMAILGRNGSGKSVLIQTILGIYSTPSSGYITSYHKGTYELNEQEDYKHIGYSAQDDEITDGLTVIETFQFVLLIRGVKRANVKREAQTLCQVFDLYKFRFHSLTHCSRGVLKRLSIAIAMIGYAGLILLDEPFAYLDIISQQVVYYLIQNLCSHGQAVLYTCSDSMFANQAHRSVTLSQIGSMEGIGERIELQQNIYSSYYQIIVRFNLAEIMRLALVMEANDSQFDVSTIAASMKSSDFESKMSMKEVKSSVERFDEVSVSSGIFMNQKDDQPNDFLGQRDIDDRRKYWMVYSIIENILPYAIVKNITNHTACFWLSSHLYDISDVLLTLHQNRQIFYSFTVIPPNSDTAIYLNISGKPDEIAS